MLITVNNISENTAACKRLNEQQIAKLEFVKAEYPGMSIAELFLEALDCLYRKELSFLNQSEDHDNKPLTQPI